MDPTDQVGGVYGEDHFGQGVPGEQRCGESMSSSKTLTEDDKPGEVGTARISSTNHMKSEENHRLQE